uniref:Uncharacterized protein n=1 Tax=Caenorhabditis japonica TaxID=281687 RepID=A0A8R1I948_CAEJA
MHDIIQIKTLYAYTAFHLWKGHRFESVLTTRAQPDSNGIVEKSTKTAWSFPQPGIDLNNVRLRTVRKSSVVRD